MGDTLGLALAIAASPFPIVPAILLLFTARPRVTAGAFLIGWAVGVGGIALVVGELAEFVEPPDQPPTWASAGRLAVGLALIGWGGWQWLRRSDATTPAWMDALDSATPRSATRLGLLLSAANPKVALLAAAGGLAIASAAEGAGSAALLALAFTAVSSISVAVPLLAYLVLGNRVLEPLGRARDWLQRNGSAVMAVVLVVLGLALVSAGVTGLRG